MTKCIPVTVGGVTYPSKAAFARAHHMSPQGLNRRLNKGETYAHIAGLVHVEPKYRIGDEGLDNIRQLAERFDPSPATIQKRLAANWTLRQAVGLDEPPDALVIGGRWFKSKSHIAREYKMSRQLLQQRLDNGMSLEQAVQNVPHRKREETTP